MGELDIAQRPEPAKAVAPSPAAKEIATTREPLSFRQVASSDETPRASNLPSLKNLDALSLEMLHEIKCGFNLSDEAEALRMLIKLGYEKAKKILIE